MKVVYRILPCLFLFSLVSVPANAQETGVLRGTILGFQGEPLTAAAARVESADGQIQEFATGADGTYSATLPAGTYTLTFVIQRQPLLTETNLPINAGEEVERNYDLSELSDEEQQAVLERLEARSSNDAVRAAFEAGREALAAGDVDTAIEQFTIASEADDQHIILANLAMALATAGRHEEAARNYSLALVQDPENPAYHMNLGLARANSGDAEGALESISRAATLDATVSGDAYYNLGVIFVNSGRADDAVEAFRQSVDANPENAQAYYQLGLALVGTAPADAVEPLERFLELAPDDPNATTAQGLLDFARTQ